MANTIITIGRQFGSGGHEIGKIAAKELGIEDVYKRQDIVSAGAALVRIVSISVQSDHHAGLSFFCSNYCVMSYLECFIDISQGSEVGSRTLQGGRCV